MSEGTVLYNARGYPQTVLDAHKPKQLPELRLLDIDAELKAAAKAGETRKVRALKEEKQNLLRGMEAEIASLLAQARQNEIQPPAPGGSLDDLEKLARRLTDELAKNQAQLATAVERLGESPENEILLSRVEKLKSEVETGQAELQVVGRRREELARWQQEREYGEQQAAAQREWEKKLPERRKQLETATRKIIKSSQSLSAGLAELDALRELLRNPKPGAAAADPLADAYKRIEKETHGACKFSGTRWTIEREVKKP